MALTAYEQGSVIFREGEPLRSLAVIAKGSAETSYFGNPFRFEPGDMIGVCDFGAGTHGHTVTAVTDVTVITYPCYGFHALDALLNDNADAANLMVNSLCRQITEFLQYWAAMKHEAGHAFATAKEVYAEYQRLSALYAFSAKKLPGLEEAQPFSGTDTIGDWLHDYYVEINGMDPAARKSFFFKRPGITSGFLRKGATDVLGVIEACKAYNAYITNLSPLFLDSGGHDLFSLVSELHVNSLNIKGADEAVSDFMSRLTDFLNTMTGIVPVQYQQRLDEYNENLIVRRGAPAAATDTAVTAGVKQNLSDSLHVILSYSGLADDFGNKFARCVQEFVGLSDRNSADDVARALRKQLTVLFHELYHPVMVKSIEDPSPPTIVKMFLNFGYVDAALAGHDNADFLYSIADSLKGDASLGIYTLREWLTAIFTGKKEPSRNEFDMDYPAHLRDLRSKNKIDEKEEKNLLKDPGARMRFELENVFPVVNKMTFGRVSTYCPIFIEQNALRKLNTSLVTPATIRDALNEIRNVDYSAYARETLFSDAKLDITNEPIHLEILPDIIIMPNVGTRGTMWQEIEGRNRASPARIFMSQFLEIELKALMIRLSAEFRWEMVKRILGPRWNDVTEPSLTSELCDFLQFYRNNRELSTDAKEDIKNDLSRANNNYKTVFVSYYSEWLQFESNGSPRLNKNVRRMMMTYCPFAAPIRERLMQNPQFSEIITRFHAKQGQRAQKIQRFAQKIQLSGKKVPQEFLDELEYLKK